MAISVAAQAASALDHLHREMDLVHHDVKPANLLICHSTRPHITLIDLGSAAYRAAPRHRGIYGTPSYLPPECAADAPASPLIDIYSLGLVLRAMLGTQTAPAGLAGLIHEATEPDPRQRGAALPDMAAVLLRLQAVARECGSLSLSERL
jgi:serine/threonine-protein kinase